MIVILAIGGIVGLATFRDQVAQELADVGVALETLDQSYYVAVPGTGYDPMIPFDIGMHTPGDSLSQGYTVSRYEDVATVFPLGDGPAGMTFTSAAVGSEKVVGVSDGDSNN